MVVDLQTRYSYVENTKVIRPVTLRAICKNKQYLQLPLVNASSLINMYNDFAVPRHTYADLGLCLLCQHNM